MTIDMQPSMAQSVGTSRSSFSSSNGIEDTPLHNSAAISNADDYDSDTSNFAPPTPPTLSMAIPDELAGAIPVLNRFQVEGFLRLMQKQIQSAGKRGFFSKKSVGPQVRERFTFEDMLCFQKGGVTVRMADVAGNVLLVTIEGDDACLVNIDEVHLLFSTFGFVQKIITFEKAGFQALVQFSDTETASSAKNARDGRRIPSYLLPDDVGPCTTRITYSAHTDLSVKFQSHQSRDYTGAHLPIAPSAIDGSGQVRLWELTPHSSDRLLL